MHYSVVFGIAIAKTKPLAQGRPRKKTSLGVIMHSLNNTEKNQQKKKTFAKEDSNWDPPGQEATFALQHLHGEVDSSTGSYTEYQAVYTVYGACTCDKMADLMFRTVSK